MSSLHDHPVSRALEALLGKRCRVGESLARHTSLRIGGPASWWVEPHSLEELQDIIRLAREHGVSLDIVGLGSNTLFPDEGIDGVVVKLCGELAVWRQLPDEKDGVRLIEVGAGCINAHLVKGLLKQGMVGAEFLMLIPGLFGGAVIMNAGTRDAELGGILERVTYLDAAGESHCVNASSLDIAYRHTTLPEGAVVVSGVIRVGHGDVDEARARAQADKDRRNLTQPYRLASVGSTFANPEGDYAGRLIEAVGLKGARCGGAQVSDLHANFFINAERATARDFLTLMARARVAVRRQFGVERRPEVRFVGFDGWALLTQLESAQQEEATHVG